MFDCDFDFDFGAWVMAMMPNIHNNKNLPQDIKDSWIGLAVTINVNKLYN